MIFDRTWRLQRLECKVAGLKAKLEATKTLINLCDRDIPGGLVICARDLPQQICELEMRVKQLQAPN